jgi:hypothetical protein
MTATTRRSTPGQHSFLKDLIEGRDLTPGARAAVDQARAAALSPEGLAFAVASSLIDLLKTMPRKGADAPAEQAEPGFYVLVDGTAVQVKHNREKTHTYASVWGGSSWDYAPGLGRRLAGMAPMTAEQAAHLGLASGRCVACCKPLGGDTVTAKVSALIGYGEICAGHHGWAYPKGAAAQREYLAARAVAAADEACSCTDPYCQV